MSYPPFDHYNEMYGSTPSTPHPQQPQQLQQHQHQDPPGAFPQWETIEHPQDLEMQLHDSPHDLDTTPLHTPTSTSFHTRHLPQIDIDLDDPPHMVPSHAQSIRASPVDNAPILLHHPQEIPQQLHTHQQQYEYHQHMSHAGPSSTSSTGAKPTTGVVRQSTRGDRARQTHPYPRSTPGSNLNSFLFGQSAKSPESSAAASPAASGPAASGPRTRSKQSQSVRFSGKAASAVPPGLLPRPPTARSSSAPSSAMPSPAMTRVPLVAATRGSTSNTRTSTSPQGSYNPLSTQPHPLASAFKTPTLVHNPPVTPTPPSNRIPLTSIKADMHYSRDTHILTASLELPGVKREHLRVSLGTAYFNKVRYVSVIAESWPVFDLTGEYSLGVPPADDRGKESAASKAEEGEKENVEGGGGRIKTPSPTPATPTSSAQKSSPISDPWLQGLLSQDVGIPKVPSASALKGVSRVVNPNLRERRFGVMRRVIQVPESTTLKDIDASLEDGVLTLRIDFGEPYPHDDEVEVPIL